MDNSPTSLFESYEQDFKQLIASVRQKLEGEAKDQRGEQRKATLRRVEMELDEADEMVSQMEIEIQGMPQSIKSKYQLRAKTNKTDLNKYKKQAKDLHASAARDALLSSKGGLAPSDDPYGSNPELQSQRTRLLAGTQSLADSTKRLEDSQRIAMETEDVGADILRNLRVQRGTIEHTIDTLHEADTSVTRASGTLNKMIRQMYKQRFITAGIIVVLVLLIGIILWEKLF